MVWTVGSMSRAHSPTTPLPTMLPFIIMAPTHCPPFTHYCCGSVPITPVIPPVIHPTSSCSWGWRWVVSCLLSWWASWLQSSPSCGPGAGPTYPNSLSFIAMGHAHGRQLAPSTHSVSRCSQPWRRARSCSAIVGGSPSMSLLARSTAIHPASSGSQGWRQVLCHPLAGLNQDVFPVSWVGWVSNEVVGLQRHIGVYFVGIPFHSPWVS